jgi:hypothetical protein
LGMVRHCRALMAQAKSENLAGTETQRHVCYLTDDTFVATLRSPRALR